MCVSSIKEEGLSYKGLIDVRLPFLILHFPPRKGRDVQVCFSFLFYLTCFVSIIKQHIGF